MASEAAEKPPVPVELTAAAVEAPATAEWEKTGRPAPEAVPTPATEPAPAVHTPNLLCLGMARTGSASLVAALRILGIGNIHHGLESQGPAFVPLWERLGNAADACFPSLPTYTGKPFTRADWDAAWAGFDVVSDVASFYGIHMVHAYPEARVILVERDADRWYASIRQVMQLYENPWNARLIRWVEPLTGTKAGRTSLKFQMGWTEASEPEDIYKNARAAYTRHYREIRAAVPPEQLLDFKLADGWEPLCRFLGKEIPDVPFPHVNDSAAYEAHRKKMRKEGIQKAVKKIFLPCL